MQRIRTAHYHLLSILLAIGVCFAIFTGLMLPAQAAEPQGNCSNGYVTDIKIKPAATATETIPNYAFHAETTSYNITL